jgi:AcrR family transcriptional regulator
VVGIPNRDRRAERREATRQEILSAAWDVAHQNGIAGLTLREVAVRVGMQPPSLYSHFDSKNAIYDAMFGQAWRTATTHFRELEAHAPADPRERLVYIAQVFFDFATADPARNQLMNFRVLPDFAPSAESYAAAVESLELLRANLRAMGITKADDVDVYTALIAGLVSQQEANDPGGTRWRRLVPRVMHSFADSVGLAARPHTAGRKR